MSCSLSHSAFISVVNAADVPSLPLRPPLAPNLARIRAAASSRRRVWRATYSASDSPSRASTPFGSDGICVRWVRRSKRVAPCASFWQSFIPQTDNRCGMISPPFIVVDYEPNLPFFARRNYCNLRVVLMWHVAASFTDRCATILPPLQTGTSAAFTTLMKALCDTGCMAHCERATGGCCERRTPPRSRVLLTSCTPRSPQPPRAFRRGRHRAPRAASRQTRSA